MGKVEGVGVEESTSDTRATMRSKKMEAFIRLVRWGEGELGWHSRVSIGLRAGNSDRWGQIEVVLGWRVLRNAG